MPKFTLISALVLAAALLNAGPAHATDAGVIAAALPDEAAECRYLTQLSHQRRTLINEFKSFVAMMEPMPYLERKPYIAERQELWERVKLSFLAFNEAVTVVRAKHEQTPACFADVPDVNDIALP